MSEMLREKFFRIYSNLALRLRTEIILVVDEKPITWNVVFLEVKENTKLGKEILKKLADLGVI